MSEEKTKNSNPGANRKIVMGSGIFLFLFGLYLLAFLLPDAIAAASGPETMTMERAAEVATDTSTYATIEDGEWNCDSIYYIRGQDVNNKLRTITRFTEAFITDSTDKVAMLVTMSDEWDCDQLEATDELTGYLTRMSEGTQQDLTNDARLARFFEAETFLELCGYCGETNSLIGAGFGIAFTLSGLALFFLGRRMPTVKPKNDDTA